MDNRAEIRAFLKSRRDKVSPEQAGLPVHGNRRVSGLRRNEVAILAGVSVEYYTQLERGNLRGASDSVLYAVARALRLDDIERAHLFTLARAASPGPARGRRGAGSLVVRPIVTRIVEAMASLPAFVQNNRLDVVVTNRLGRALYAPMFDDPTCGANTARFVFLTPAAGGFYADWEGVAGTVVGQLRVEAARTPDDPTLTRLIGELSTRSDPFRALWGASDVHVWRAGTQRFRHPVVGEMALEYEPP